MTKLTAENYIDIREAVARRLDELKQHKANGPAAQAELDRKIKSLTESFAEIDTQTKALIEEEFNIPVSNETLKLVYCIQCGWKGMYGDLKDTVCGVTTRTVIQTCPNCGGHGIANQETTEDYIKRNTPVSHE